MPSAIIADTSVFILLSKIGELDLLRQVYGTILTTPEIAEEFGQPLPNWVQVSHIGDTIVFKVLQAQLDRGESSAIALALEREGATIILDDNKARKVASRLGLKVTGTIAVLVRAKNVGCILSIRPVLDKIVESNFQISAELIQAALNAAGE